MKLPEHLNAINKEFIGIEGELYRIKIELVHFAASTKYKLQSLLEADTIAQISLDKLNLFGAEELLDKQIADRLNISSSTVNTHRVNIETKIGCDTKVGICRFAIEKHIV